MKTGLVLEGGGLRGIFSAGVLDVLMEEGIEFDGAVGVSAGAAFGCNYKSRQPRRAIRYNLKFAKDPRYSSVRSLMKTGDLFNAQFCYHDIPEKLFPFDWKAFRENPMQFYLVCTDVETGKPVYHLCDNDSDWEGLEWFRASGSMPLVSRIVEVGGHRLLDGGISDSIPLRFMEDQGFERNVVILTRPAGYVKKPASMMSLMRRALRNYPATADAIANRHQVYNETLAYIRQREAGKFALVIRPDTDLDVGRVEHDRQKIRAAYKAGRRAARRRLSEIRRFLNAAKKGVDLTVEKSVDLTAEKGADLTVEKSVDSTAVKGLNQTVEKAGAGSGTGVENIVREEMPGTFIDGRPKTLAERQEDERRRKAAAQGSKGSLPEAADSVKAAAEPLAEPAPKSAEAEVRQTENAENAVEPAPARLTSPESAAAVTSFSRGRRTRKTWKPGRMTTLREQGTGPADGTAGESERPE